MGKKKSQVTDIHTGTTILKGTSRDDIAEQFDNLKASNADATLMAGAVGRKSDGTFELRIDIVHK